MGTCSVGNIGERRIRLQPSVFQGKHLVAIGIGSKHIAAYLRLWNIGIYYLILGCNRPLLHIWLFVCGVHLNHHLNSTCDTNFYNFEHQSDHCQHHSEISSFHTAWPDWPSESGKSDNSGRTIINSDFYKLRWNSPPTRAYRAARVTPFNSTIHKNN